MVLLFSGTLDVWFFCSVAPYMYGFAGQWYLSCMVLLFNSLPSGKLSLSENRIAKQFDTVVPLICSPALSSLCHSSLQTWQGSQTARVCCCGKKPRRYCRILQSQRTSTKKTIKLGSIVDHEYFHRTTLCSCVDLLLTNHSVRLSLTYWGYKQSVRFILYFIFHVNNWCAVDVCLFILKCSLCHTGWHV